MKREMQTDEEFEKPVVCWPTCGPFRKEAKCM
jgi:hypothetical protein